MVLDDLLKVIKEYNPDEIERVTKAYKLAEEAHKDQKWRTLYNSSTKCMHESNKIPRRWCNTLCWPIT